MAFSQEKSALQRLRRLLFSSKKKSLAFVGAGSTMVVLATLTIRPVDKLPQPEPPPPERQWALLENTAAGFSLEYPQDATIRQEGDHTLLTLASGELVTLRVSETGTLVISSPHQINSPELSAIVSHMEDTFTQVEIATFSAKENEERFAGIAPPKNR